MTGAGGAERTFLLTTAAAATCHYSRWACALGTMGLRVAVRSRAAPFPTLLAVSEEDCRNHEVRGGCKTTHQLNVWLNNSLFCVLWSRRREKHCSRMKQLNTECSIHTHAQLQTNFKKKAWRSVSQRKIPGNRLTPKIQLRFPFFCLFTRSFPMAPAPPTRTVPVH